MGKLLSWNLAHSPRLVLVAVLAMRAETMQKLTLESPCCF